MKKFVFSLFIIFLSSCVGKGLENDTDDKNPPIDIGNPEGGDDNPGINPNIIDCDVESELMQEGANVIVTWNKTAKNCVNSCGGGYIVYYLKRNVAMDDDFLKKTKYLPANVNTHLVYTSNSNSIAPNYAGINLDVGKWYIKVASFCNEVHSELSNAFVINVD